MAWQFYVYELQDESGNSAYIGKGSGYRLPVQKSKFKLSGQEVARFRKERDAYAFERQLISERNPTLNKHPGGNGSTVEKKLERRAKWEIEMEKIGTRAYAARLLLKYFYAVDPSKLDAIRRVAYGAGA